MATRIYKIFSPSHPEAGVYIGGTKLQISLKSILGDYRKQYRQAAKGKRRNTNVYDIAQYEDAIVEVLEKTDDETRKIKLIRSTPGSINKTARDPAVKEKPEKVEKIKSTEEEKIEMRQKRQQKYYEANRNEINKNRREVAKQKREEANKIEKPLIVRVFKRRPIQ